MLPNYSLILALPLDTVLNLFSGLSSSDRPSIVVYKCVDDLRALTKRQQVLGNDLLGLTAQQRPSASLPFLLA